MCRICYSVDARTTDIGLTGKTKADTANASVKVCNVIACSILYTSRFSLIWGEFLAQVIGKNCLTIYSRNHKKTRQINSVIVLHTENLMILVKINP